MGKYLNVGNADFQSIIGGRYVDKTGLIEYINSTLGTKKKLTCVSRPRRFGKSFAAQMLCAYYDKSCDSRELFQNFAIAKSTGFEQHLNQYNVIYLDITGFLWDMSISRQNADEYNGDGQKKASKEHQFKDIVELIQYKVMGELALAYPNVKMQNTLPDMLLDIAEQTGDKFIVIIDECDALFREAEKDTEVQERYILLLRALFKNSGSTDRMIEAAYMTGILPIKKYGTHSAMTDFMETRNYDAARNQKREDLLQQDFCRKVMGRLEELGMPAYSFGAGRFLPKPTALTSFRYFPRLPCSCITMTRMGIPIFQ